jgi:hypothetical protein
MRKIIMNRIALAAVTILLAMSPIPALAEGAVAIAEPRDVAKDGYSSGISYNYGNASGAEERALQECRNSRDASPETRKLCKLVRTFRNQCVAVALDPEAGTPGAGWAIGNTKDLAERDALRACEDTAGRNRQGKCVVTAFGCDGSAK